MARRLSDPRSLVWALALLGAGFACDEARSTPAASPLDEAGTTPPATKSAPATNPEPAPATKPEPEPEPARPPGPSCDQRASASSCVDYGTHRGGAEPRCAEGTELGEFGCAREQVIGRCTLEATGVVIFYYEGRPAVEAEAECATIEGVFKV